MTDLKPAKLVRATKLVLKPRVEITNIDFKQLVWLAFLSVAVLLLAWRLEGLADRISDFSVQIKCEGTQDGN